MEKLSPMMTQYFEIKKQYEDTLLFFRLGDFYELFFNDAIVASRELEITLTGKDCGQAERAPMCGVPYHSAQSYITRLIKKGFKVAICEQITDPKASKGIVERAVVRIITPGTFTDTTALDEKSNNYLASAYITKKAAGVSFVDITTGDVFTTQFTEKNFLHLIECEIIKYAPAEILFNGESFLHQNLIRTIKDRISSHFEVIDDEFYSYSNIDEKLKGKFEVFEEKKDELIKNEFSYFSLCASLHYIDKTQKTKLRHITEFDYYNHKDYLEIDDCAKRNLELTETMRDKKRKGSLFGAIDDTSTAMGARMLKRFIERPLTDKTVIQQRLDSVEEFIFKDMVSDEMISHLKNIRDMERLLSKISLKTVNGKDLLSLKDSFKMLLPLKKMLGNFNSTLLKRLYKEFDALEDLYSLIEASIDEEAPFTIREGKVIKKGYNEQLDKIKSASDNSKQTLIEMEARLKEQTDIKNLKIGFNKVFGYYIEVTNSFKELVPDTFIRKQTLANCERYITEELKELEDILLNSNDRVCELEYQLFCEIRDVIFDNTQRVKHSADIVAYLDVLLSFSLTAKRHNYCKPQINDSGKIEIEDGRHPVVEKMNNSNIFVPNDTKLTKDVSFAIITGPNMAGKSTYMRQVALISLMMQMGSYVPAKKASLCIVDKIFTRVGASDDLAMGQSTFMVEMNEVANILTSATKNSLVILDEIGRGTSTYDGLSIAWAVVEHIREKIDCKTLFATHYHELTHLEGALRGVKNYSVAVKKRGDDITFLRRIIEGGADDSYGVEVAKLAGVPQPVIEKAKVILKKLENGGDRNVLIDSDNPFINKEEEEVELSFASVIGNNITDKLKAIDITTLTPIEALNTLNELINEAKEL